jgi:ABC-type Fe3+/spermidine/putrescine transport system ATPase subunit
MQSEEFTTLFGSEENGAQENERPPAAASVRGVSKSFKGTRVLENIDFDVSEGESLVLLGASGSGKTTILRVMAGLEEPDTGRVFLHGKDVSEMPARERNVGVIFQNYALFPRMTVEGNIGYGLRIRGRPRKEMREEVERLIEVVGLTEHHKKYPAQLSGGQQQRVAIARTLAYKPQVLLFDEPFGALDAQIRVRLRREIHALLKKVNVPAIFITHDQEEALEMGDRIAVINAGRIEQIGTPHEVYNKPETEFVATFLGAANLLLGVVSGQNVSVGSILVPAPEETAGFQDGQAVKIVFRPEDVYLSRTGALPEGCRRLMNALVEEISFVGAYERLTVRLDMAGRQPAPNEPPLYSVNAGSSEGRTGAPVIVTRSKSEAATMPLQPADRVAVCLTSFRVLPNFTLATERAGKIVPARK